MYYSLRAVVLSRRPWGEDGRLIVVFSDTRGKKILRAIGAQKITAKMAGFLEPLMEVRLSIVRGKVYDKIIGVELVDAFPFLRNDFSCISLSSFFLQAVDVLSAEEEHGAHSFQIFSLIRDTLQALDAYAGGAYPGREGNMAADLLSSAFVAQLLSWCGWGVSFRHLETSEPLSPEGRKLLTFLHHADSRRVMNISPSRTAVREVRRVIFASLRQQLEQVRHRSSIPSQEFLRFFSHQTL